MVASSHEEETQRGDDGRKGKKGRVMQLVQATTDSAWQGCCHCKRVDHRRSRIAQRLATWIGARNQTGMYAIEFAANWGQRCLCQLIKKLNKHCFFFNLNFSLYSAKENQFCVVYVGLELGNIVILHEV